MGPALLRVLTQKRAEPRVLMTRSTRFFAVGQSVSTSDVPPRGPLPLWRPELGPLAVDGDAPLPLEVHERLFLILDEDGSRWPCFVRRSYERRGRHTVVW
jgi:hypothetical protein